jgi:hypothetical protein
MKSLLPILAAAASTAFIFGAASAVHADDSTLSGTFTGLNDHITTGGVSIIETAEGTTVVLLDANFSLDGAPDPSVGFGINGEYVSVTDLGALQNLNGLQAFVVPANVNVADFDEVYIWCEQFTVPLGVASIN